MQALARSSACGASRAHVAHGLLRAGSSSTRTDAIKRLDEEGGHPVRAFQAATLATPWQRAPAGVTLSPGAPQRVVAERGSDTAQQTQTPAAPAAAAAAARGSTPAHVHMAFSALFAYLALLAAAAHSRDWWLDLGVFGALWGGLWTACARLRPSGSTVSLLCLLPVMHLTGALGLYSWELGNLSWDVLVHIANGCIGTLLAAAVLGDVRAAAAAGDAARDAPQQRHQGSGASSSSSAAGVAAPASEAAAPAAAAAAWRGRAVGVLQLAALLLGSSALVEVVEAAGGRLAGVAGEGVFLRGPGDFCTASLPCSEEVDTAKDCVDNVAGMLLGLLALAARPPAAQQGDTHSHSRGPAAAAQGAGGGAGAGTARR